MRDRKRVDHLHCIRIRKLTGKSKHKLKLFHPAIMHATLKDRRRLGSSLRPGLQKTAKAGQVFNIHVQHFCNMSLILTNLRGWMGPDLQIVVLDMKLEDQMDRMRKRHGGHESAVDFAKVKCFDGRRCGNCDIEGNLGR